MPKLAIVNRAGEEAVLDAKNGLSVMEVIRDAGFDELQALCGGCCSCATCHVYVSECSAGKLPGLSEDEDGLLEGVTHRLTSSRLSCQIKVDDALDGARFIIAPED